MIMKTILLYDSMSRETWNEICDFVNEEGIELRMVGNNLFTAIDEDAKKLEEKYPYADWEISYFRLEDVMPGECDIVPTTCERSGYPCLEDKAIIGFDDWDECEKVAKKWGLSIQHLTRRSGQEYWYRTNAVAYGPYKNSAADYGMNFEQYSAKDANTYYENEVRPMLNDFENLDELQDFIRKQVEIQDAIANCLDSEIVLVKGGEYFRTINEISMRWTDEDGNEYAIGLVVDEY